MSHHPEQISAVDSPAEDVTVRETDDLIRLYRYSWVIVHTEAGQGETAEPFVRAAHEYADRVYGGRIRPGDVKVEANTDLVNEFWVHVLLYKPVMFGEFKRAYQAQRFAQSLELSDFEIVVRNSRRDHELRSYGAKKLT